MKQSIHARIVIRGCILIMLKIMARYATTEKHFKCRKCHIKCAQRERVQVTRRAVFVKSCPRCEEPMLEVTARGVVHGVYVTSSGWNEIIDP